MAATGGGQKNEDMNSAAGLCVTSAEGMALGPGLEKGSPFKEAWGSVVGDNGESNAEAAASASSSASGLGVACGKGCVRSINQLSVLLCFGMILTWTVYLVV